MRFELAVAWRYFLSGRSQTALTVAGVTVGVTALVFISALVDGLARTMITQVLGTVAPVVVHPPRPQPRIIEPPLRAPGSGLRVRGAAAPPAESSRSDTSNPEPRAQSPERERSELIIATVERSGRERERILQWQRAVQALEGIPGVTAISPIVEGPAIAARGTLRRPILVRGVDPRRQHRIVNIERRLQAGAFDLSGDRLVVGEKLAEALGVAVGARLRVTSSQARSETFQVSGVFDMGFADLNERWVFVSRGSAQRLLNLEGSVTAIELATPDRFAADRVADRAALLTGLRAESWSRSDPELLALLQVQSASSLLVQGFVLAAVAFGIASVLVVAVLQRRRDIGILLSMGTPGRNVAAIFLLQAGLVGTTGALLGAALGIALSLSLSRISGHTAGGHQLFPIELQAGKVILVAGAAIAASLVAGFIPARRAAALDPAEVIHYG
jgi:lipoprotein-releasing system permease protein